MNRPRASVVAGIGIVGACVAAAACGASAPGNYGSNTGADGGPTSSSGGSSSGSSSGGGDAGGPSSGSSSSGGSSSGGSSGGSDAGAIDSGPPLPTSILAVHASANLYDYRLCFGVTIAGVSSMLPLPAYPDDPAHPMPETNYPGVPVGGAALLPPIVLGSPVVTPYVVRAQELDKLGYVSTNPNEPTCDALICPGSGGTCLTPQYDYFALPAVTLPALGGALALAVEGCVAQGAAPGSTAQCGAGYVPANGNLAAAVARLAPSTVGGWAVQIAQLSPSFGGASGDAGAGSLVYVDPSSDASVPLSPAELASGPPLQTLPLGDAGILSAYFALTPASGPPVTESLAAIQFFEAPGSDPTTYFDAPTTYFAAIVGDATDAAAPASLPDGAPNPAFDGHGLHVIAYPEPGN